MLPEHERSAVASRRMRRRYRLTLVEISACRRGDLGRRREVNDCFRPLFWGNCEELGEPNEARDHPAAWSPKRVAAKPGCRQLAVTPVPCRRRASSRVKRMLQSLERP